MKIKKSTFLPAVLFIYLLVMAYIGRGMYFRGEYFNYFAIFGVSLLVIILLHFSLKKKERMKAMREKEKKEDSKNGEKAQS